MKNRYSGEIIGDVGLLKIEAPELSLALDNALLGGKNKKGPTPRFKETVALARKSVWSPIKELLAHPYYQIDEIRTDEGSLSDMRARFYDLAREDLAFLESRGDGEQSLSIQTQFDRVETYAEMLAVQRMITFFAQKFRLQDNLSDLIQRAQTKPFVLMRLINLYPSLAVAENEEGLAKISVQVKDIQQYV